MSKVGGSEGVRSHLVGALGALLVGPFDPEGGGEEVLPMPPSRWYLTGFLAPQEGREVNDPTDDDALEGGDDKEAEESGEAERGSKRKSLHPASVGLTLMLPPGGEGDRLVVGVSWADYKRVDEAAPEVAGGEEAKAANPARVQQRWARVARDPAVMDLSVSEHGLSVGQEVPGSGGLWVVGHLKRTGADEVGLGVVEGTRVVSLFVVNRRAPQVAAVQDQAFAFQVEMGVSASCGIMARPDPKDARSGDWDAAVADLQFRGVREWGVGHGVSVVSEGGAGGVVRTRWLPSATVKRVVTREAVGVEVGMEALSGVEASGVEAALGGLAAGYEAWIEVEASRELDTAQRQETRELLVKEARRARDRISAGVSLLASDAVALRAFGWMNEAMAASARRRSPERYTGGRAPSWRLFQLAFVLMNLPSVADEEHEDRDRVELIFFPTGGGKTEAYLGLIGFALLMRRMEGRERPDRGLGVAVMLRYTLRLLTLDQLSRAATLVCALEVLRRREAKWLGEVRFSIGLWVGRSATANRLKEVSEDLTKYKSQPGSLSPFPLTHCPWCGEEIKAAGMAMLPSMAKPESVRVSCLGRGCDFGSSVRGLPVLFVDEQIYRELPCFVVATVDKYALMPWRGEAGRLFGKVIGRRGEGFVGVGEGVRAGDVVLGEGLRPPTLIVQDELHLISGPLGTMVGLYETAIEALCTRRVGEGVVLPKIVASTATVKRASQHVRMLFGRDRVSVFPPPGVDDQESYFSQVDHESPGRLYVGVAASGKPMKAILLRVYTTLMGAAERRYDAKGAGDQAADPYMTLAGYFNSLRELGGMRRLTEDEVRSRCESAEDRKPEGVVEHPWLKRRKVDAFPVELTSRESTRSITQNKTRLGRPRVDKEGVDVVLASNMISVGVDIERLGLMVVCGQPKTTSEYIQASSRVGRDAKRPGLVVTCYNLHKPRDRSHYEHFEAYHGAFYRHVEAMSLTPFSGPALDRGLAGALMSMVRHGDVAMTPAAAAQTIGANRAHAERGVEALADRAARLESGAEESDAVRLSVRARARHLLDVWDQLAQGSAEGGSSRCYSPWDPDKKGKPLLRQAIEADQDKMITEEERNFIAPTSMRDVEPSVHLWVHRGGLKQEDEDGDA